jgi:hypothetical protein
MKKLYVVTSGEYSDYEISAIFDTKELAEKYIDSFSLGYYTEMRIEEYDLNPNKAALKKGHKAYFVRMDKDGNTKEINILDCDYGFDDGISYTHDQKLMNVHCFAKDEKHAIKITNEKRIQVLAYDTWGRAI